MFGDHLVGKKVDVVAEIAVDLVVTTNDPAHRRFEIAETEVNDQNSPSLKSEVCRQACQTLKHFIEGAERDIFLKRRPVIIGIRYFHTNPFFFCPIPELEPVSTVSLVTLPAGRPCSGGNFHHVSSFIATSLRTFTPQAERKDTFPTNPQPHYRRIGYRFIPSRPKNQKFHFSTAGASFSTEKFRATDLYAKRLLPVKRKITQKDKDTDG